MTTDRDTLSYGIKFFSLKTWFFSRTTRHSRKCNCIGGTYCRHFHSGSSGAGNAGSVRDEPDFGPNNLQHVSSFRPCKSQGEQINLGDQENSVDSTDSEFNNNPNRNSNNNIITSKQPLISTIHPDPGPATSSSETSFFTCEDATGNSDCADGINQTIPMDDDCFPSRCHKHRNSREIGGNCVGHLDPVSATSGSETSFLTCEAGNSECEDDKDETNSMRCGRFPGQPMPQTTAPQGKLVQTTLDIVKF